MDNHHVSHKFYLSLLEIVLTARQRIIAVGGEYGLTAIQTITLMLLDDSQPRPMKNFCMQFNCDASNITGIIDGLEKKNLVSRQNDPTDRRVKVIRLERRGKTLQLLIAERLSADSGLRFDTLSESEMQLFEDMVEKIAASSAPTVAQEA